MGRVSNFYRSDKWLNFRRVLMMERRDADGILYCAHCGKPIVRNYDCIGHHKIELTEDNVSDAMVSLNPANVDLIHFRCHNDIHKRFGYEGDKRVFYVHGSPLSGKTTFVREAASPNDLVVDLDSIYQGISINPRYKNSQRLKQNVFIVRDCLLDQIRCRTGKWQSAWIITTEPLATNRQRIIEKLGAEEIHIDTSRDECLMRFDAHGTDATRYIEDYFRRFTK